MQVQKADNTHFGAIIFKPSYSKVKDYMFEKLDYKQYDKFENIIFAQRDNPVDIFVSVIEINGKKKLEANIGEKYFKENIFQSGIKAFKKAVKYANNLYREEVR